MTSSLTSYPQLDVWLSGRKAANKLIDWQHVNANWQRDWLLWLDKTDIIPWLQSFLHFPDNCQIHRTRLVIVDIGDLTNTGRLHQTRSLHVVDSRAWMYSLMFVNPLECKGNYSVTSNNMKFVHLPLMVGLLHLVQRAPGHPLGHIPVWHFPRQDNSPSLFAWCRTSPTTATMR